MQIKRLPEHYSSTTTACNQQLPLASPAQATEGRGQERKFERDLRQLDPAYVSAHVCDFTPAKRREHSDADEVERPRGLGDCAEVSRLAQRSLG